MKHRRIVQKLFAVLCAIALLMTVGATTASAAGSAKKSDKKMAEAVAVEKREKRRTGSCKQKEALTEEHTPERAAERTAKMKEHLAKQLADGTITQAQYDEIIKAMENGTMPLKIRQGKPHDGGVKAKVKRAE